MMDRATHLASRRPCTPAIQRVWAHISRAGADECWPWTGSTDSRGRAKIGPGVGEITRVAPKVILEAKLGRALLPGMETCHTCDVPGCCNVAHLYEGTHQQNMTDMSARGRARNVPKKGERNHFAKLTAVQVVAIRTDTRNARLVASDYGISVQHTNRLRRGEGWSS